MIITQLLPWETLKVLLKPIHVWFTAISSKKNLIDQVFNLILMVIQLILKPHNNQNLASHEITLISYTCACDITLLLLRRKVCSLNLYKVCILIISSIQYEHKYSSLPVLGDHVAYCILNMCNCFLTLCMAKFHNWYTELTFARKILQSEYNFC